MPSTQPEQTQKKAQESPLRVAFVTPYDSRDIRNFSGSGYHIALALEEAGLIVERIGLLKNRHNPINVLRYLWNSKVRGLNDHPQRDPGFLRHYARQVELSLRNTNADLVFGAGGLALAYLETDLPMVLWTDSTFAGLLDYYDKFSNLSARTIKNGHAYERSLLERVDLAILTSQWAADVANEVYGFNPDKVCLAPLGAGFKCDRTEDDIEKLIEQRPGNVCRLLWVGVDWERKGGDITMETARILNERGIRTELRLVGIQPPSGMDLPEWVEVFGYLDKRDAAQRQKLDDLFSTSHFFLLPTKAEGYGIVFCEASSFGLPSIAARTGGTGDAILEGVSGWLHEPDSPPSDYADTIERCFRDQQAYAAIARSAFEDYQTRTNWTVFGEIASKAMRELVDRKRNKSSQNTQPNGGDDKQSVTEAAQ